MKVIIIGGVAAGMSTAAKLKRNLHDAVEIVCYAKGQDLSFGACGLPFFISDWIKTREEVVERRPEQFAESGIQVHIRHEVLHVDPEQKQVRVRNLESGEEFVDHYDKLVVASGADVRRFPPFDRPVDGLYELRDVVDAEKIKNRLQGGQSERVIIVGAGFIGLELVDACQHYAAKVTLVELAPRVLLPVDPEFSERLEEELRLKGVDVRCSTKLSQLLQTDGRLSAAVLSSEKGEETLDCDLVINCAGIAPATAFISGVDKLPNGAIKVDEQMATSLPDIYAAGDCSAMRHYLTGEYVYAPLGTNANKQGRIIADILAGKEPRAFALIGCAAMKMLDLDIAKVGLNEDEARRAGLNFKTHSITGNSYASYYSKQKVFIKLLYGAEDRKILGMQIVGQGIVVPRANYYAVAIRAGMTVDDFGFMDLCYSPPFGGVWDAAIIAANTAR